MIGQPEVGIGQRQDGLPGEFEAGGLDAGQPAQDLEDLTQRQVAVPQNIPFADAAPLHGAEVSDRHVIHIHEVHPRLDVGPHAAFHEVYDDLAGRGRLDVPFSDRGAGVDDDDRQPRPRQLEDFLLGQVLGALVVPGHLVERHRGVFGPRSSAGRQPDGPDRAGIDDPLGAQFQRGFHQGAGAGDVHLVEDRGVSGPEGIVSRDVVELRAIGERATEGVPVPQVPVDLFHFEPLQIAEVAVRSDQHAHVRAGQGQRAGDGRANESCRAGDEGFHLEDVKRET